MLPLDQGGGLDTSISPHDLLANLKTEMSKKKFVDSKFLIDNRTHYTISQSTV